VVIYPLSTDIPATLRGQSICWQVQAVSTLYGSSIFTNAASVFTGANPPAVPVLSAPATNSLQTAVRPTLAWKAATVVPSSYQIQVAKDSGFQNLAFNQASVAGSILSYTVPVDLEASKTYFWRIRSLNAANQYSNWSAVWSFKESLRPPVLSLPSNGSLEKGLKPTFTWNPVSGATSYTVQFSLTNTNNVFGTVLAGGGATTTNSFTPVADLAVAARGKTVYWRVQATTTTYGPSAWSETRSFVAPNPPTVPTLKAPTTASLQTLVRPTLSWNAATGNPVKYQIQVATNVNFASLVFSQAEVVSPTLTYTVPQDLPSSVTYYWRVRSVNANNEFSSWSAVWNFKESLRQPSLTSPINGATNIKILRPTLSWNAVPGATSYTVQFSKTNTNSVFGAVLSGGGTTTTTSFTPVADLAAKGLAVYWRVQAVTPTYGPSAWSETRSLILPNPSSVPALSLPATNTVSTTYTPNFDWNAAAPVPSRYWIQASKDSLFTPSNTVLDKSDISGIVTNYIPTTPLPSGTILYWRVKSINANSEESAWSAVRIIKTIIPAPTLSTPAQGSTTTLKPSFSWTNSNGATSYKIQLSYSATMATPFLTATSTTNTYTPAANLAKSRIIYWRVTAIGPAGSSPVSSTASFITPAL
jgi:hypothetical protein